MDLFADMISALKITTYPILLYGAGFTAKRVTRFLEENGVDFDGYLVDKEYLHDQKIFLGRSIYPAEDFLESHECYVVVAFCIGFTEEREAELSANKNIKRLFALDCLSKFAIEGKTVSCMMCF